LLGRISSPIVADDLRVEALFNESIVVVASAQSRWASRSKIDLGELVEEPWILPPPDTMARVLVENAFRTKGIEPPRPCVVSYSMQLRMQLLALGQYLTILTDSTARFNADRWSLKVLPVGLGQKLPVAIVTLKNRTLTPSAQLFIDEARVVTKAMRLSATG
jgi:DNA-binding transcriptional LysR family regulator